MDETELARDEVNDLPGDERDAGWGRGRRVRAALVNMPGVGHGDRESRPGMISKP